MKKFVITGISVLVLFAGAQAQEASNALIAGKISTSKNIPYMNDINTRAMRDFVSRFNNVTDEVWHKSKDYYIAVFIRDSVHYRVMYSSRGDLSFIMKYYEEPKLDRDVRAQVKSVYYDYQIFIVQEIDSPDNPAVYIINLQGANDWKKIKLCNNEMEVIEEYKKGK
jgi:hypothetical protein